MKVEISRVTTLCYLLEGLLCGANSKVDWKSEPAKLHPLICTTFLFSYVWSLGGNLVEKSLELFENHVRDLFSENHDVKVQYMYMYMYMYLHKHNFYRYMHLKQIKLFSYLINKTIHFHRIVKPVRFLVEQTYTATLLTLKVVVWRTGKKLFLHSSTIQRFLSLISSYPLLIQ